MLRVVKLTHGTPRAAWCPACLTPAVLEVDFYALSPEGVTRALTYRACQRCEEDRDASR